MDFGLIGEGGLSRGQTDTYQWDGTPGALNTSFPVSAEIRARAAVRARLGKVIDDNLFYVTGGLALAQVERGFYHPGSSTESVHTTWDNGYVLGVGAERAIRDTMFIRLEYLHSAYDQQVVDPSVLPNFCCDQGGEITSRTINLAVVFRFHMN